MPFNLGAPELIIVLVVVLIVFGPGRLPSIGQSLGKGIREFRKATTHEEEKKPEPVAKAEIAPTPVAPAPPPDVAPVAPSATNTDPAPAKEPSATNS